jgi:hypothetical protein
MIYAIRDEETKLPGRIGLGNGCLKDWCLQLFFLATTTSIHIAHMFNKLHIFRDQLQLLSDFRAHFM